MVAASDTVLVEARYKATAKATGKPLDAQVAHVWDLRDGKVVSSGPHLTSAGDRVTRRPACQISSFPVLSPKLSWCTPSLSSSDSIRFDIGVCAGNARWRSPFSWPDAPPATRIGSGS